MYPLERLGITHGSYLPSHFVQSSSHPLFISRVIIFLSLQVFNLFLFFQKNFHFCTKHQVIWQDSRVCCTKSLVAPTYLSLFIKAQEGKLAIMFMDDLIINGDDVEEIHQTSSFKILLSFLKKIKHSFNFM